MLSCLSFDPGLYASLAVVFEDVDFTSVSKSFDLSHSSGKINTCPATQLKLAL
jgi:hypothetical protein